MLRIVTALLFIVHGSAKLFHVPHLPMFDHLQLMSLIGLQGVLEAGGGLLLLIGLFSRPVAFVLCGDMAVAYFMAHWPKSWLPLLNGGDLAVLFCFVFLYLWIAGPGALERRHAHARQALSRSVRRGERAQREHVDALLAAARSRAQAARRGLALRRSSRFPAGPSSARTQSGG